MAEDYRVIIGPQSVGGILGRLIELPDGSGRVETWGPNGWTLGGTDVAELLKAPPASHAKLIAFGVISPEE